MTRAVLLDSAPLGLLTAPPRRPQALACWQWLAGLIAAGVRIVVPEITDYELRRELLRTAHAASIRRLDALAQATEYLPLTTAAMRKAAELWALARQQGWRRDRECSVENLLSLRRAGCVSPLI